MELVCSGGQELQSCCIVGQWETSKFGHQALTVRPDGTATLTMTLTPMAALIYGRKVTLELEWSLEGEFLTQRIVGGSPARSKDKLIKKFGDTNKYRVHKQDSDELLLADMNAEHVTVCWTAVATAGPHQSSVTSERKFTENLAVNL